MDDETLQRSLRARPPADPVYRSRLTAGPGAVARHSTRSSTHIGLVLATLMLLLLIVATAVVVGTQVFRLPAATSVFLPRFEYVLPAAMEPRNSTDKSVVFGLSEGSPDSPSSSGHSPSEQIGERGVIVVNVNTAVTHPCPLEGSGGYANRDPLPDDPVAFLEVMQQNAGLVIDGPFETTLDGRPAIAGTVTDTDCGTADLHFSGTPDMGFASDHVDLDIPSRLILTRVGGSTILVQAWARTPEGLATWLPIARELIDSIQFLDHPVASPSASGRASQIPTSSRVSPGTNQAAGSR